MPQVVASISPNWLKLLTLLILAVHFVPLLVALAFDLARLTNRMWNQRLRSPLLRFLDDHLFRTTCFLLLVACLFLFGRQVVVSGTAELGPLLALIVPILILALGCQYGQVFFSRLKKLGPLEFFELEAPELLELLDEVFSELEVELDPRHGVGEPLSPEKMHAIQRADLYLAFVELQPTEAWSKSGKRRLGDRVFKVGSLAIRLENWLMARTRLRWCCRLLTEIKEEIPEKVFYNLGMADFLDGRSCSGSAKEKKLREALRYFSEAARKDPRDHESFFWMAFVEDELGMLDLAIRDNQKVLELRHAYAPAKLNLAISRVKKGELEQALQQLLKISPGDFDGTETLGFALQDPELKPLLEHPQWGGPAREFLGPYSTPS